MKMPSFAGMLALAAAIAGASFVVVGATRLNTPTSKDILAIRNLGTEEEIIAEAKRAQMCVEKLGDGAFSVHGRESTVQASVSRTNSSSSISAQAGSDATTPEDMERLAAQYRRLGRSPELTERITAAIDVIDWHQIEC